MPLNSARREWAIVLKGRTRLKELRSGARRQNACAFANLPFAIELPIHLTRTGQRLIAGR